MCLIKQSLSQIDSLGGALEAARMILNVHAPETRKNPAFKEELRNTVEGGRNDMAFHLAGCEACQAEVSKRTKTPHRGVKLAPATA